MITDDGLLTFAALPDPLRMKRRELVQLHRDIRTALRTAHRIIDSIDDEDESYVISAAITWSSTEIKTVLKEYPAAAHPNLGELRRATTYALNEFACISAVIDHGLAGFLDDPDAYRRMKRIMFSIDMCENALINTLVERPSEETITVFAISAVTVDNLKRLLEEYLSTADPPDSFTLVTDSLDDTDDAELDDDEVM